MMQAGSIALALGSLRLQFARAFCATNETQYLFAAYLSARASERANFLVSELFAANSLLSKETILVILIIIV